MTLEDLAARCKGSVFLTINSERTSYKDRRDYLVYDCDIIGEEELAPLLAAPFLYTLQFYPDTPIGSYLVAGVSVEDVVAQALAILDSEKETKPE